MRARLSRLLDQLRPAWLTLPFAALGLYLLGAQIVTLSYPIIGEHAWRQSDVYSVASNFLYEDPDFFHPRIDWTRGRSGVMGMEPPILAYLAHGLMRIYGDDPSVARVTAWSLSMLGLLGFLAGAWRLLRGAFALTLFGVIMLSPMALYELRQIQPDAPMAMFAAAAALLFAIAARSERKRDYVAALLLFTLAVLLKGPVIVLAPAMALFAVAHKPVPLRSFVLRALPLLLPLCLLLAWFAWAGELNETYNAGRSYFAIDARPGRMLRDLASADRLRHVFGFVLPVYAMNWVLFPALCAGVVAALAQPRSRRLSVAFLGWLACVAGFLALFSSRLKAHWYYADLALPALAYFTAHGLCAAGALFAVEAPERRPLRSVLGLFVLAALALTPLAGASDGMHGLGLSATWTTGAQLGGLAALFLLAGVCWAISRRAALVFAAFAFTGALVCAAPRATSDAVLSLAERSAAGAVDRYREKLLAPLREAIDRFSTRDDLVVTNRFTPQTLYQVRRKGFAVSPKQIAKNKLGYFRRRHALLYVHFGPRQSLPPELRRKRPRYALLHHGRGFSIYCLVRSCPDRQAPASAVAPAAL